MNNIVVPAEIGGFAGIAWTWAAAFAPRVLAAAFVLAAGLLFNHYVGDGLNRLLIRTRRIDPTLRPVLLAVVRYAIFIMMLVILLNQLGIETTSLLTILGAAGLAIGLALQGTLSNIAAGIMLLWLRPFRLGDYIEVNNQSGIVEETGLFNCILKTYDGARVFAPNSTLWNFSLKNHSHASRRLLAVSITLAASGAEPAIPAIMAALRADGRIITTPAPEVFLESMTSTNVVFTCRFWSGPSAYGALQRSIVDLLRGKLIESGMKAEDIQAITRVTPPPTDVTRLIDV